MLRKQSMISYNGIVINEIKVSGKSMTSTDELKVVFNEYFTDIGPNLAQTISHESYCNFDDFITKRQSTAK